MGIRVYKVSCFRVEHLGVVEKCQSTIVLDAFIDKNLVRKWQLTYKLISI